MPFSMFQVFTKLFDDQTISQSDEDAKRIYITGTCNLKEQQLLQSWLTQSGLSIDYSQQKTVNCPVRRFFESSLMLEILKKNLKLLDKDLLHKFSQSCFNAMSDDFREIVPNTIFCGGDLSYFKGMNLSEAEYTKTISKLKDVKSFGELIDKSKPLSQTQQDTLSHYKQLLLEMAKMSFCALGVVLPNNAGYPINIYGKSGTIYGPKERGKKIKGEPLSNDHRLHQSVHSMNLGILRSTMPIPQYNCSLKTDKPSTYTRPVDNSDILAGAKWPEMIKAKQIIPFVNSISGTFLILLRLIAYFRREERFVYEEHEAQLIILLRCYIAFMIHNAGGHCIEEFTAVLKVEEIQEELKHHAYKLFQSIDTNTLFIKDHEDCFKTALEKTCRYNRAIMAKEAMHQQFFKQYQTVKANLSDHKQEHSAQTALLNTHQNMKSST